MTRKLDLLRQLQSQPEASPIWQAVEAVVTDFTTWRELERRYVDGPDGSADARRLAELRRRFEDSVPLTLAAA